MPKTRFPKDVGEILLAKGALSGKPISVDAELDALMTRLSDGRQRIIQLLVNEDGIVQEIGALKFFADLPVYRPKVEKARIKEAREYAEKFGHGNPDAVARIIHMLIVESRKHQAGIKKDLSYEYQKYLNASRKKKHKKRKARTKKK